MLTLLKFEIFNPSAGTLKRQAATLPSCYYVTEITGVHPRGGFTKQFLKPFVDYSNANSVGSRGATASYFLSENKLYEVQHNLNWKKQMHYFCKTVNGKIIHLTTEEAIQWLNTRSV